MKTTTVTLDKKFWIWASIRILIVVLLIVGAFFLGVRMGFGEFTESIGMDGHHHSERWGYKNMEHYREYSMSHYDCQQHIQQILSQSGETITGTTR